MTQKSDRSTAASWARFRFSVVGSLLSSPPGRGELKAAIRLLATKTWTHPVNGRDTRFAAVTIERWYYTAQREKDDPVGVLRRAVRKDCGKVSLDPAVAEHLCNQYHDHKHWTYKLHYDNLTALLKTSSSLGCLPSYSTVRRYMQAHGLVRKPRPAPQGHFGEARAAARRENREIRSYEAEYVGSLWHLDFHHGSLKVLSDRGQWQRPMALGILDDHSRLCCHLQWYLLETAEDLVHGLSQAIQKRGLPRALLTDNGAAMVADEVAEGLLRLGIVHEKTLRRNKEHLVLSSEHRAAPAAPPVSLQLVATDVDTTHLEVVGELHDQQRCSLQDQVLDLLTPGEVLTRAKLRESLGVKNERLGEALEWLEQAGRLRRTPTGWQRPN